MTEVATAAEKEALRGSIERENNKNADDREQTFARQKRELEDQFHVDMQSIRLAKEQAMRDAGLNSDGSDPQGRPVG